MDAQVPLDASARAPEVEAGGVHEIASDVAYQRLALVNLIYAGAPTAGAGGWVLIDAGVKGSRRAIVSAVEARFGESAPPQAIVLTHGHFDHVGALRDLADVWDVPIYAHPREHPFLNGGSSYPAADPSVGGGMMAALSRFYPRGPIDVSDRLRDLPADGTVPGMPGWAWLHTPGHTPGHVSLWRASDRTLIAGDAFITTRQESAYAVALQNIEIHGPPMYFTPDWTAARESVRALAALEPELVVTGHGRAVRGAEMRSALQKLAAEFDRIAVPENRR